MRLGDIRRRLGLHRDDRGLAAAAVREALGDLLVLGAADGEPRWMHPGKIHGKIHGKSGTIGGRTMPISCDFSWVFTIGAHVACQNRGMSLRNDDIKQRTERVVSNLSLSRSNHQAT